MYMDVLRHPIKGSFPVIYPDLKDIILSKIELKKIMVSVAFLNRSQKEDDIHRVMNFQKQIFLDCGIFQRGFYRRKFTWKKICDYRKNLVDWYSNLKPDLASSLDVPNVLGSGNRDKIQRLRWSIENYDLMKRQLQIPLILGISVFEKKDIILVKKMIQKELDEIPEFLGIGGMVPLMRKTQTQPELAKIILNVVHFTRKNFPNVSLHVYGLGDHRWYPMIRLLGALSSDYAGYINAAGRGGIFVKGLPEKYILKKIVRLKTKKGILFYTRQDNRLMSLRELKKLRNCNCPFCKNSDPVLLEFNREGRIIHNLHVVLFETEKVDKYCLNNDFEGLKRYIKETVCTQDNPMKPIAKYALSLSNAT